jgi:tetratricopeptide (TPR) repeat protein
MTDGHCFISYSTADALEFARQLADELEGGRDEFVDVWFDKDNIDPARDWDDQIVEGIKSCKCMAFVMSKDSTAPGSMCKNEWTWALKYKKIVIPIRYHKDAEQPFGLGSRQWIDFTGEFEHGLAKLRKFLREMNSPEGVLQSYKDRLSDAERALRRAKDDEARRIQAEIEELKKQIVTQQKIVDNPKAAAEQTQQNIKTGLEREQKPEKTTAAQTFTKFINTPPGIAPIYFQDRYFETEQIADFLRKDAQRLMTIVGRAGIGKTATICRLLKDLERGVLPDGLGEMKVDGIVYLSEAGSHKVNFANIFYDLCKLLSAEESQVLDTIYKNPQGSTESKIQALLDHFHGAPVVLLLDNFEPLVNDWVENFPLRDSELDEALRSLLNGAHTSVKVIITTRVPPHELNSIQPGRQRIHILEKGLEAKYAEEMLRQMDADGIVGLKNAESALLQRTYERTRGFPKALEALYQILVSDRYTKLEEILAKAENYLPDEVVKALVGEAFSRLDVNAQKVMQALAVYNRPVTPAAVDYLLAPHLPAIDSAPILQRLANMHFARKESGRFYLHPVDREFAFGLVPEKDLTTKDTKGTKEEPKAVTTLPKYEDLFKSSRSLRASRFDAFTQHDLTSRAADFFAAARKPRAEWKKLEDLSAQLAEFELRCAAGDYDTAASVLLEIDFDYLLLWGHYRLMIDLHMRLKEKITDKYLRMGNLNGLGFSYYHSGKTKDSLDYYQEGLNISRESKDRDWEGVFLNNLGNCYSNLGNAIKSIEFYEQGLIIDREVGNRNNEGSKLANLGSEFANLGDPRKAIENYEKALVIAQEIGNRKGEGIRLGNIAEQRINLGEYELAIQSAEQYVKICEDINKPASYAFGRLAQAYLHNSELTPAREAIEAALQYDEPQNNHNASALHGIIALRQGDEGTARQAFTRAIAQADEILAKTPDYYSALDAKGLALCGLAICGEDGGRKTVDRDAAIDAFQKARKIAPHAGLVKSVLRLFDELAKCDTEGILKDVRKAVEGK